MSAPPIIKILKKLKEIENKTGEVLYESLGDNSRSITLSKDSTPYKIREIFYSIGSAGGAMKSVKVEIGKIALLDGAIAGYFNNNYYGIRICTQTATITGKTLSKTIGYTQDLKTDNTIKFADTLNEIYIHKVIGYKK